MQKHISQPDKDVVTIAEDSTKFKTEGKLYEQKYA